MAKRIDQALILPLAGATANDKGVRALLQFLLLAVLAKAIQPLPNLPQTPLRSKADLAENVADPTHGFLLQLEDQPKSGAIWPRQSNALPCDGEQEAQQER